MSKGEWVLFITVGLWTMAGTGGAAEQRAFLLHAMAYHAYAAMRAAGSKRVQGAFKAVEDMRLSSDVDFERRVIIVSAHSTDWHVAEAMFGIISVKQRANADAGSAHPQRRFEDLSVTQKGETPR
jgi:hypothetical protein